MLGNNGRLSLRSRIEGHRNYRLQNTCTEPLIRMPLQRYIKKQTMNFQDQLVVVYNSSNSLWTLEKILMHYLKN